MGDDLIRGILAAAALREEHEKGLTEELRERDEDILIEKICRRDWKLFTAYMDCGFTREEALSLLSAIHST